MHLILQAPAPSPRFAEAEALLAAHGVAAPHLWIAPYTSDTMWEKRRAVQQNHAAPDDWVISADVDELHEWPDRLDRVLQWCDRQQVNCVQGPFIDRLSPDGVLAAIAPEPEIARQFPHEAEVICHLRGRGTEPDFRYGTVKLMAVKGDVMPSRGGHHARSDGAVPRYLFGKPLADFAAVTRPAFRFTLPMQVHHYKWVDTLIENTRRRMETRGVSAAGKAYGETLVDYFARHGRVPPDRVARRGAGPSGMVPWQLRVRALRTLARVERMMGVKR